MKQPDAIFRHYLLEALDLKLRLEIMKHPDRRRSFERAAERMKETLRTPRGRRKTDASPPAKTKRAGRNSTE